jgi:4-carboxymuconolactone decarboxylase
MDERWTRGIRAFAGQFRLAEDQVFPQLSASFGKPMATEAIYAAGAAWDAESPLSLRDRSLAVVTALASQGGAEERLRPHVRWAIAHGATRAELEALLAFLAVYIGYARASVAMEIVREELDRAE